MDVTQHYSILSGFLVATNTLLMITLYCFCCGGKNTTKRYDRLFTLYNLLVFFNLANYIWLICLRFRHEGRVCSGDFITDDVSEDAVSEYYITGFGSLLKWYFIIETIVSLCCFSLAALWICYTPNAKEKFFTPVEYTS